MTTTLSMQGIRKSFFGVEVLHRVDFAVGKGEIMGLCGENGAGKSTLMKILAGIYPYEGGEIGFRGAAVRRNASPMDMQNLGVSMIHQELNLLDELTVAQNIFLAASRATPRASSIHEDARGGGCAFSRGWARRSTRGARCAT